MEFTSLGLSAELLRALEARRIHTPTPVQQQAIPPALVGRDLLAAAQTGTGKTLAFALPLLQRLAKGRPAARGTVRALVLTPTRELAAQVADSVMQYGCGLRPKVALVHGGVGYRPQIDRLRRGVDVLIATPGRLIDHLDQGNVRLDAVEMLVLDEADRMLDMGFIHDIRRLMAAMPDKGRRQTLLFSATFSQAIRRLAEDLLEEPVAIEIEPARPAAEGIDQRIHPVDRHRKRELLSHMIDSGNWRQVLVFTRTRRGADRLAEQLVRDGLTATAIHGNKSQAARTRALDRFRKGRVRVLVATDVAARGIDIERLPHVINFELPDVAEDYVHRIGRTGRAGQTGQAISLVSAEEQGQLRDIERLLRRDLPREIVAGYAPDPNIRPRPGHGNSARMAEGRRRGSRSGSGRGGPGSGRQRRV